MKFLKQNKKYLLLFLISVIALFTVSCSGSNQTSDNIAAFLENDAMIVTDYGKVEESSIHVIMDKVTRVEMISVSKSNSNQILQIMSTIGQPFVNNTEDIGDSKEFSDRFRIENSYLIDLLSGAKFYFNSKTGALLQIFE